MLVRRFYDDRLAQASYLIGCQRTGEAIVVDPARDVGPYLEAARAEGVRITRVTETHIHADFLSGARELAARTGAALLLSGEGGRDWQYGYAAGDGATLLRDGDTITMGGVRLDVWHTPGHTPEHLAFVVTDTARGDEPVAMLSGDFLFVGDVGRPDLLERAAQVAGTMEAGARDLFRSIARTASLPDHLQLWPGHGAGSACGKALGAMPTSTLGYERRTNWAFGVGDESDFVAAVLDGQPSPPTYFATMKRVNRDGPAVLGARDALPRLDAAGVGTVGATARLVDVRSAAAYGAGHRPGTLLLPLNKSFTNWAGWLLTFDRDVALIADGQEQADDARRALASIGIDRVTGWFDAATLPDMTATATKGEMLDAERLAAGGRRVIDLREPREWDAGHVPGAEHHPLGRIAASLATLDRTTPLAIHCQAGGRSAIGASLLEEMGFTDVVDLSGGWNAWSRRKP